MGLVITEMIDQGMVDAIVSTGALMCHGMIEQMGHTHFRHDRRWSDEQLYKAGYARVYDTLELEQNLAAAEETVRAALGEMPMDQPFGSWELHRRLGEKLRAESDGRGILQSAAAKDVPVYVPSFTDSEMGIDLYLFNLLRSRAGEPTVQLDLLRDLDDYFNRIMAAESIGIFTIGGGAPRNWAQQVAPMAEIVHRQTDGECGGLVRFQYGVRLCPEPTHFGGLSGVYVLGGGVVGQVRAGAGGRALRRSVRRRDDCLADPAARGAGADGAGLGPQAMEEFVSEPITPHAGTFDARLMATGTPGLPSGFDWHGASYEIRKPA